MKALSICIAIGILLSAGCGLPTALPQRQETAAAGQANNTAAGPASPISPSRTPTSTPGKPISPEPTPTISQAAPEPQAAGRATAKLEKAVIRYERSGGFAGLNEQWTIYPDGRVVLGEGGEWQIPPQQVEQLIADIVRLGFFTFDDSYVPKDTCCDRFFYSLTIRQGDKEKTVTTMDDAPNVPDEVWQALGKLSSLLNDLP